MKIITSYPETLDLKTAYALTRTPENQNMKDREGSTFGVKAYALYEDVNSKGNTQEVLALLTDEDETYSTVSPTFKQDFADCVDLAAQYGVEASALTIAVIGGESKNGRHYIGCKMV
uniref:SsDNA binding protein n=1 Tax=Podoviridae sp. ctoyw14 TaxID=2826578 RepID=A0A8S5LVY7_9CAUD|nr:MAG TPA: ssDNA binding protein [Podoviridae sp. ctoyw14]